MSANTFDRPPAGAQRPRRFRVRNGRGRLTRSPLPVWSWIALAVLFIPVIAAHEPLFGHGLGLRAAGSGVAAGLILAALCTYWRWDVITSVAALFATHLLLGGIGSLPETLYAHVIPTGRTLQFLVMQPVVAWRDLLTLAPPASSYVGPSVMPWICGLLCAFATGVMTMRRGWVVVGTIPLALMGIIAVAWGPSGMQPPVWAVMVWFLAIIMWWMWSVQHLRLHSDFDILIGRRARRAAGMTTTGHNTSTRSVRPVRAHVLQQALVALVITACTTALAFPVTSYVGSWDERTVLRDLVEPPLDLHDYPSPLAAFRHLTTEERDETLISVSQLPHGARVRLAVMDTYNGITFGMSDPEESPVGSYISVGSQLPVRPSPIGSVRADTRVTTSGLMGPWVPTMGQAEVIEFSGDQAQRYQDGLHWNRWADAALTTGSDGDDLSYHLVADVPPRWSDSQLAGAGAVSVEGQPDTNVPDGVKELAVSMSAIESTPIKKARAIERTLAQNEYFSNGMDKSSRSGHRADRLARMIDDDQMVGDDEQYATLMALMLHSLGMSARVVMGAYPSDPVTGAALDQLQGNAASEAPVRSVGLKGADLHVWVEAEFVDVGWAIFDPTPPRDNIFSDPTPDPTPTPRPQVLQPPNPPEEPPELPPAITEKNTPSDSEAPVPVPWGVILTSVGIALLIIVPIAAILLWKARRLYKRRHSSPLSSVEGSWNQTVDLAADAGTRLPRDMTRAEAAWSLADSVWQDTQEDTESPSPVVDESTEASVDWRVAGQTAPATVLLASIADRAQFGQDVVTKDDANRAWGYYSQLKAELRSRQSWFQRALTALSVRSLRRHRHRRGGFTHAEKPRTESRWRFWKRHSRRDQRQKAFSDQPVRTSSPKGRP